MQRSISPALVLIVLLPAAATAKPGPVSPIFPANDVSIEEPYETVPSCTDERGITVTILWPCIDPRCDEPLDIIAERRDADGNLLGAPITVATDAAPGSALSCNAAGDFVVRWNDHQSRCDFVRAFSREGVARSEAVNVTAPDACAYYPTIRLYSDGGFLASWHVYDENADRLDLVVRRFDEHGAAFGPAIRVNEPVERETDWPDMAIDELGFAVISWRYYSRQTDSSRKLARVLDPAGALFGDEILVAEPVAAGVNGLGHGVIAEGGGSFLVVWGEWELGGQVARRIALDDTAVFTTTTSTLPPVPDDFPVFAAPRTVYSDVSTGGQSFHSSLHEGQDAAWHVRVQEAIFVTRDDGRRWRDPVKAGSGEHVPYTVVTDGRGNWLAFDADRYNDNSLALSRSADDGRTWSEPVDLVSWPHLDGYCSDCSISVMDAESDAVGTTVVAWRFRDYVEERTGPGEYHTVEIDRVYGIASQDGGLSWGLLTELAADDSFGWYEDASFDVATDERGTWMVAWVENGKAITARSTDGARTWSAGSTIAEGVSVGWGQRLELATDGAGVWVAVFGSGRAGLDGDVYSARSLDDGVSWETPRLVNIYGENDSARDFAPSIATDAAGRWIAMWSSHHMLGGAAGLDSDVFAATSTNAAATWSSPVLIDPSADEDFASDELVRLVADERGVWLAVWQSRFLYQRYSDTVDELKIAFAGERCTDGRADIGEECDDGNRLDGDGCDHNCTVTACGNGVLTAGEPCDDGNDSNEDGCLNGCVMPSCGDGFVDPATEPCDDGNSNNEDDCTDTCQLPACGDGFVHAETEACDDGNVSNADECTEACTVPVCGDGFVRAGVEECDDGNLLNHDSCVEDCRSAACGDGWIEIGTENCDPVADAEFCTTDCELNDECGDVDLNGVRSTSDARRILLTAVGLDDRCPLYLCNVDGTPGITATDARLALLMALGLEVKDPCRIQRYVVLSMSDSRRIGALQVEADYSAGGGSFSERAGEIRCETLAPETYASYHNDPATEILSMGWITVAGIQGTVDLARCPYQPEHGDRLWIDIRVVNVSDTQINELSPPPLITYRLQ